MSLDKPKRNKPRCRPLVSNNRKKAIMIMAILERQIQEAESLKHFLYLMQNLAITVKVSMPTLALIYLTNFVNLGKGYFDYHPKRINEEPVTPEDLEMFGGHL